MLHHDIDPSGDRGHWAAAPSSNGIDVLVQIGEVQEARQARLRLSIEQALNLASDLGDAAGSRGVVHVGTETNPWFIEAHGDVATLTLRDVERNADPEATLTMPKGAMRAMADGIQAAVARVQNKVPSPTSDQAAR